MKLVLFDCDGTLIDSAAVIHACMELAFLESGHAAPDISRTKSIIGLTLDIAIAQMLERQVDDHIHHLVGRYKHHSLKMRSGSEAHEPFYDGIWDVLDVLRKEDEILLGVVTGKSRRGLDNLLAKHALEPSFITTRTADECPSKPNPAMVLECCCETGVDPAATIVIGDAIYDMQMARSAGATAIGVNWGYSNEQALRNAGAHDVAHRPQDLLQWIKSSERQAYA
ncbi:MAG: HAD-IA family hydrolase [Rhizobiaceae bacterium]|nr:HAD-IA family hydrolase [Rhizobiaceae bacterium]